MQSNASVINLNTSLIVPNKYQPRKVFDETSLQGLAESIKKYGIINPILVRKKDDKYEIIAGERRFRASQILGMTEVPVIVKNADEQQMAELALIENLERQNLSPIEEAKSYEEIMRIGNQTQSSLAAKIGKSQSAIANKIRLLSLPQEVQDALAHKKISERHARSLLEVSEKDKQLELLNKIITERLTVKETERIIKEKEINDEDIKQAISDIMKSLNIKEEEKEDDNMNNGNFFPNYDNNVNNNNASLNMMNMQSMNQPPVSPEPEVVMPTMVQNPAVVEPMVTTPNQDMPLPQMQMGPEFNVAQTPILDPIMPTMEPAMVPTPQPMMNETPSYNQEMMPAPTTVDNQPIIPNFDVPLFNSNAQMPNPMNQMAPASPEVLMPVAEPSLEVPQPSVAPSFEVPVTEPVTLAPMVEDKLSRLKDLLNENGYTYKVYSNETDNCVIIEFPKN